MKLYKAPNKVICSNEDHLLFLGGSIEMGAAENWQKRLADKLTDYDNLVIMDPRRDDWDSSWVQDPTPGTQFHEQVTWELVCQDAADTIIYYFDPNTKSPITLLELGIYKDKNLVVCCPENFYRYGNVVMVCDKYKIPLVHSFDTLVVLLQLRFDGLTKQRKFNV